MKILHTADWHYGMRHYGMLQREQDMYDAGNHVVRRAIDLGVNVVVMAGDMLDTPKPSAYTVQVLADQVRRLREAGIAVVGIDGNHDTVDNNWLKVCNVTPLTSDQPILINGVSLLGINSMRPSVFKQTLSGLTAKADILVIHQAVSEMSGFETQDLTALEIATELNKLNTGVKCVLMGDIHNYAEAVIGAVRFIYSGSIEVTAVNENQDKSFSILDIQDNVVKTSYERIPTRPLFDLELNTEDDLNNLLKDMDKFKSGLVIISYDWKNKGLAERAESILVGRPFLYRLKPTTATETSLVTQLKREAFERKNSLAQLKDAILAFFEEATSEYELITQMLQTPADVDGIVTRYMASKNISVKV